MLIPKKEQTIRIARPCLENKSCLQFHTPVILWCFKQSEISYNNDNESKIRVRHEICISLP